MTDISYENIRELCFGMFSRNEVMKLYISDFIDL